MSSADDTPVQRMLGEVVRVRSVIGVAVVGFAIATAAAVLLPVPAPRSFLLEVLAYLTVLIAVAAYVRRRDVPLRTLFSGGLRAADVRLLALAAFMLMAFSWAAVTLLYAGLSYVAPRFVAGLLADTDPIVPDGIPILAAAVAATTIILAPVTEEVLRVLALHRWSYKWSINRAVLLSSVCFAVLHVDLLGGFLFGVVMALLYIRLRTIWAPIAVHMTNNAVFVSLDVYSRHTGVIPEITVTVLRGYWWSGICALAAAVVAFYLLRNDLPRPPWVLPETKTAAAVAGT
jgi:membrane protease YdiL (CAAX protease family)